MSKSEQVSAGPFCLSSALTNLVLKILRWTGIPHLASQTASQTGRLIHSLLLVLLTVMMVLTASFFLYATFYYAYMPAKVLESTHPNANECMYHCIFPAVRGRVELEVCHLSHLP